MLAGLDTVGAAIGVQQEEAQQTATQVRQWLQEHPERCLIVFDNLINSDLVRPWLPRVGRAQVVVSTTRQSAENLGVAVPVDVFTDSEALAFLGERTGRDKDEVGARRLAVEVDRLPLALAQAAWMIRQQRLSYETYLERLRDFPVAEYLQPVPGEEYPWGAAGAVALSLQQLGSRRKTRIERAVLDLLAVYSPAGVPRSWLHVAGQCKLLGRQTRKVTIAQMDAALGELADASLIVLSVDGQTVGMHRFIQRVIRDAARKAGNLPRIVDQAARLAYEHLPALERVSLDGSTTETFVEQSAALWSCAQIDLLANRRKLGEVILSLQDWAGRCLGEAGDLTRAIPLLKQTLADSIRVLGIDDPATLTIRNNLAYAYQVAGRLDEAIELYQQTLDDSIRVLGEHHPDTWASRNNLAYAHRSSGRLQTAIELYQQTLDDSIGVLGEHHPDTWVSRNNLAYAYRSSGRLDEAIELYQQTLKDSARVLGVDYPATLTSRNNLAYAYEAAGRLGEAIELYQQTLDDRIRVLGKRHLDTLASRNNLANAYRSAGQLETAIELYQQTLDDRIRVLGEHHPDTLTSRNNLASSYQVVGRFDKAIELYQQTLTDCIRTLGEDHPLTMAVRGNLLSVQDVQ
ncbi:FxSxx-COOH system tetratricopeptide repeat protein [Streptosporangium vulgare]